MKKITDHNNVYYIDRFCKSHNTEHMNSLTHMKDDKPY